MYCTNCGDTIPGGAAFCTSCGTAAAGGSVDTAPASTSGAGEPLPVSDGDLVAASQPVPARGRRKSLLVGGVLVVFVGALVVGIVLATTLGDGGGPETANPGATITPDGEMSEGTDTESAPVAEESSGSTSTTTTVAALASSEVSRSETVAPDTVSPPPTATSTTSTAPTSPEVPLAVVSALASNTAPPGQDSGGNPVTYVAGYTIDGFPETAWRTPGDGVGESIQFQLELPAQVTRAGLIPGYAKIDPLDGTDRFEQNRRIRAVRWSFDDGTEIFQEFVSLPELQFVDVPGVSTRGAVLEIVETSESGGRDYAAISEIVVFGRPYVAGGTAAGMDLSHVFPLDPVDNGSYGSGGHAYPATDIFAPEGTRFVAVTSGVVDAVSFADVWDPDVDDGATKGGLFVAIIGDDGVRYYGSHLSGIASEIAPGVPVAAGQLIGFVGTSGNARDTTPHLHFGISAPTSPTDWEARRGQIDPVPFLDAWRDGDLGATPQFDG